MNKTATAESNAQFGVANTTKLVENHHANQSETNGIDMDFLDDLLHINVTKENMEYKLSAKGIFFLAH